MIGLDYWGRVGRPMPSFVSEAIRMRFPQGPISATVFVGVEINGRFTPTGTGFLVGFPYKGFDFFFVATADHVVDIVRGDSIWLRMNRKSGDCSTVKLSKADRIIHKNPNNDIALFGFGFDPSVFNQGVVMLSREQHERFKRDAWVHDVGDEVAAVGLYSSHFGETKNLPVVRVGHIALMPGEGVLTHRGYVEAYLIETKSIAGLSGSPVYVNVPPVRVVDGKVENLAQGMVAIPLGLLTGYHIVASSEDQIQVPLIQGDKVTAEERRSIDERNTGFAVVVPWERLLEMVETESVMNEINAMVDKRKAQSGFRPASILAPGVTKPSPNTEGRNERVDHPPEGHNTPEDAMRKAGMEPPMSGNKNRRAGGTAGVRRRRRRRPSIFYGPCFDQRLAEIVLQAIANNHAIIAGALAAQQQDRPKEIK